MIKMKPENFFTQPQLKTQKKYEALRAFYIEKQSANKVASRFGYKVSTVYSMVRDFRKACLEDPRIMHYFFVDIKPGPKSSTKNEITETIVEFRKKNLSIFDIKAILDARNLSVSEQKIYQIIKTEGFVRLPRRSRNTKNEMLSHITFKAHTSGLLVRQDETFNSDNLGVLCFLPYIIGYDLQKAITDSSYPETTTIPKLNSILSFLALKLSNVRRYSVDDIWCMDRGLGMFAGLNVLPKAAWFSSYANRVTKEMNLDFLKKLHQVWVESGLLSDTVNLDFISIPYWGDDNHLENNWSGTRHHALTSILAALSQDPESGIITHGDATIRHDREANVVTEFVDFYKKEFSEIKLRYLVFDSKFTTYENLKRLDEADIYFITIRRRGKNIIQELDALPAFEWKNSSCTCSSGKK